MQPFGRNRYGPKIGWGLCPFRGGGARSLSSTVWPRLWPTCVSSVILIRPTVWPQCTNVTERQDRQRTDSIGLLVHCQKSTIRCLILQFLTHDSQSCCSKRLPKSCNQCVQLGAVGGAWFRRKEVESAAAVGLCCVHNACAPMRCLPERKKLCHL